MTTAKHTAGPWFVDPDDRPNMEYNNHIVTEAGETICFMAHGGPNRQDEFDANAALIASAPTLRSQVDDLAAALRRMMGWAERVDGELIDGEGSRAQYAADLEQARAALSKADR